MAESLKQAKAYSVAQLKQLVNFMELTRYPLRNKVIVLLSAKAGMRACEISGITWFHVLNDEGTEVGDIIRITNDISKSHRTRRGELRHTGGRRFYMADILKESLQEYYHSLKHKPRPHFKIVLNQQGIDMNGNAIAKLFYYWFKQLGWKGYSSHSGRRTFITNAARTIPTLGGSLEDVRLMAGHRSLSVTQKYIERNPEVIKRLVNMI